MIGIVEEDDRQQVIGIAHLGFQFNQTWSFVTWLAFTAVYNDKKLQGFKTSSVVMENVF